METSSNVDRFEAIAREHATAPFFNLVCITAKAERASEVLSEVRKMACFDRIEVLECRQEDFGDLQETIQRKDLRVGANHGCLIILWDLDAFRNGRGLADWMGLLPSADALSPVVACFGLTGEEAISFREFVELTKGNYVGFGGASQCIDTLRRWCAPRPLLDGTLRMTSPKGPGRWLRSIRHDYFQNGVLHKRALLKELGLCEAQREVDLLQAALRNVLSFLWTKESANCLTYDKPEDKSDLYRRVYDDSSFRLVVPEYMGSHLVHLDLLAGEHFATYGTPDEAAATLADLGRHGVARLLVREPEMILAEVATADNCPPHVPQVLVSDTPYRLGWSGWTSLLSQNVLGSFTESELLGDSEGGDALLDLKRDPWRVFCFLSLPGAFDRIIGMMIDTYTALHERTDENQRNPKFFKKLHSSLAQVVCAKGLYFGASDESCSNG
ncbi:hypothetical protein ACFL5Q_03575 [Planctomycetota bacterium]